MYSLIEITSLPNELLAEVYKCLDVFGVVATRQTCRRMLQVSEDMSIWKALFFRQVTEGNAGGLVGTLDDCSVDVLKRRVLGYASSEVRWKNDPQPVVRNINMKSLLNKHTFGPTKIILPGGQWMLTRNSVCHHHDCIIYAHNLDAAIPTVNKILHLPPETRIASIVNIDGHVPRRAAVMGPNVFYFALLGFKDSVLPSSRASTLTIYTFDPKHPDRATFVKSLLANDVRGIHGPVFQDDLLLHTLDYETLRILNWRKSTQSVNEGLSVAMPSTALLRNSRLLNGSTLLTVNLNWRSPGVQVCVYPLPKFEKAFIEPNGRVNPFSVVNLSPEWIIDVPGSKCDSSAGNINLSGIRRAPSNCATRLSLRVRNTVYGIIVPDDLALKPSVFILQRFPGLRHVSSDAILMGIERLFVTQGDSICDSLVAFPWPALGEQEATLLRHHGRQIGPWLIIHGRENCFSVMDDISGRVITPYQLHPSPPQSSFGEQSEYDSGELEHGLPDSVWSVLDLSAPQYLPWTPDY